MYTYFSPTSKSAEKNDFLLLSSLREKEWGENIFRRRMQRYDKEKERRMKVRRGVNQKDREKLSFDTENRFEDL